MIGNKDQDHMKNIMINNMIKIKESMLIFLP